MSNINLLETFNLGGEVCAEKDKVAAQVFDGARRRIMQVKLRNGAVLSKHKAAEPITVLCLAGNGFFSAGGELEEKISLSPGVFLTLEGGIEHEVVAAPELHILVTKFKND